MTFQDTAIPADARSIADAPFPFAGECMPPPALRSHKRHGAMSAPPRRRLAVVLALEDGRAMSDAMREICNFLEIFVERIDSHEDLLPFLQRCRPMAVVAAIDAEGQDGCNVLMTVARHDPALPVLLLTGGHPAAVGAADAVTELWGLTEVMQAASWPPPGTLVEFLCRAGLQGNCLALLPA